MVVRESLAALLAGLIFGFGLCLSRMVDPAVVVGFTDVFGNWDPRLLFVMGGALFVTLTLFPLILKKCTQPLCAKEFSLPLKKEVDWKIIVGSILFGIGWGIGGVCPGPAITALAFGMEQAWIFLGALLAGMFIFNVAIERAGTS